MPSTERTLIVAVDIGGTFTDITPHRHRQRPHHPGQDTQHAA
ncbi:MAG: hypothetical protein WDN49_06775 [Acetobacteraceae bacterium]